MKQIIKLTLFALFALHSMTETVRAQCYSCGYQNEWTRSSKKPKKALKLIAPTVKSVKWYSCVSGFIFGVQDFGDSTKTYVFSKEKVWLGTETRYIVRVPKYVDTELYPAEQEEIVTCPGPNVLPKNIWPLVANVFLLDDLNTLMTEDGAPYWVCDLFKVELPEDHAVSIHEGTTTLYVASMDHVLSFYTDSEEISFDNNPLEMFTLYLEPEFIYAE